MRRLEVENHAALAGVQEKEPGARLDPGRAVVGPVRERADLAGLVTRYGPLDLHHIGTEVAQELGAERRGDALRDVEDADVGKWRTTALVGHEVLIN